MITVDPARTALLVMDLQVGLLAGFADADDLVRRANDAVARARTAGATLGWVRVAFEDSDLADIPETSRMAAMLESGRADALRADAPTSQIDSRLGVADGDVVVRKTRVGAFGTTNLDEQLRARGIDTLLLAGISTSGVVLSTARDAMDRDYRVFVLGDLCADRDADLHDILLRRVLPKSAQVVSSSQISFG